MYFLWNKKIAREIIDCWADSVPPWNSISWTVTFHIKTEYKILLICNDNIVDFPPSLQAAWNNLSFKHIFLLISAELSFIPAGLFSVFETGFLFLFTPPSLPLIVVRPYAPTQPPSISSLCNYVNVMFVFIGSCHSTLAAALSQLGSIGLMLQAGRSEPWPGSNQPLRMAHLPQNL